MLQLRSMATATESGKSPSMNVLIACTCAVFAHSELILSEPSDRLTR